MLCTQKKNGAGGLLRNEMIFLNCLEALASGRGRGRRDRDHAHGRDLRVRESGPYREPCVPYPHQLVSPRLQ